MEIMILVVCLVGVFGVCLVVCLVGAPNTGVCLVKMDQTRTKHGYQSRPIFLISSYLYTTVFSVFRKLQCLRKSVVYIWNIEFMGMYRRGGCIYARVSKHTHRKGREREHREGLHNIRRWEALSPHRNEPRAKVRNETENMPIEEQGRSERKQRGK